MSWHVQAIGRASAVAAKLAEDFPRVKCQEPEETIKAAVASIVATALAAFGPTDAVKVTASGSQSTAASTDGPTTYINSLSVSIEPLWGFVE